MGSRLGTNPQKSALRKELADPELGQRMDLVISELQRVTRLLNGLLPCGLVYAALASAVMQGGVPAAA